VPALHPDAARARAAVRASLADLEAGRLVLVGLSGGADSLALTVAAAFAVPRLGLRLGAVVVDHGLQDGSAQAAARAAAQARELGADPVDVARVEVGRAGGPEAAARAARRAALTDAARRHAAVGVLLAHTQDDQAETVLLGLARGSGARSLAGMRPHDGLWRRPLLSMTHAQTRAVCDDAGLHAWADPHNEDPAYARVRVRRHLLPAFDDALGPGTVEALARTADLVRADADLLDELADQLSAEVTRADGMLEVAGLLAAPPALRSRVLRRAALSAGCPATDLSAGHVAAVSRLVTDWHGQLGADLPGSVVATRSGGALRMRRRGVAP